MTDYSRTRGFTLIELMIVVALIGLLAAIAYPSYRLQVEQSRRAEMQGELMGLAQLLERVYAKAGCYNPGADEDWDCTTGTPGPVDFRVDFPYYDVSLITTSPITNTYALTAGTYTLKALPKGAQAGTGALYIDHAGRRYWDENDDGDITDPGENDWKRG